ncbi:hypothetical protein SO802_029728 [Lithocarpus litseifolius]|uniref:CBS domain-containing protein n=1 Tax=Lithocarpus litseifolius TaxID=425828 RepID=A0AAW2BXA3_9ROSI
MQNSSGGVAIALALKKVTNIKHAIKKIVIRTLKLLFWGIILQGGYSHSPNELVYGVDIKHKIRWCGILQRIALVYFVVALIETLTHLHFYCISMAMVQCGMRGHLGPACSAVGYVDRQVWGIEHLYSACLDTPEAILSGTIGIHYGHVLIHFKIDIWGLRTPFLVLEWIGMNATLVFVMAAQGIFAAFVNGWYYESQDKTLVYWIQKHVFNDFWHSEKVFLKLKMASHGVGGGPSRRSMSLNAMPNKKKQPLENGSNEGSRKSLSASSRSASLGLTGEHTVKRLRLSKALTVPENTTLLEACHRMAACRVDALLLTDSNALLCGILTDNDITTRVIAHELNLEDTPVSKVMTRNPVFVLSDTLAVEALQKMVQGKFRHLPVVENGEVIALLDIAKCLYDAIARLERAAEKGKAIVAAVEGVEKHWGTSSGSNTFIETLRERMFRPSLSTVIPENSKVATVSPTETVLVATKKMLEFRTSSAVVMTPNPECATIDTPIVDALHTMHDGKFLHIPVVDRDGKVVAVVDVLQITHAAVSTVGGTAGISTEATNSMMQKFWDSAMALTSNEDEEDARSEGSLKLASEGGTETGRALSYPLSAPPNTFAFKIQDKKGRMHRFTCETHSLADLIAAIIQRVGDDIDPHKLPQILGLRLHLDYSGKRGRGRAYSSGAMDFADTRADAWASAYSAVAAGAALVAGLGVLTYMKRLEANAGALTNYEVVDFLGSKGAANDSTRVLAQVSPSEYKVYDYLVQTAACNQTREHINDFVDKCKIYGLAKAEVLNIINIRPTSIIDIYTV